MKITMYYSSLVYYENGVYYTHPMHGRLLEEYSKKFDEIIIFAPINQRKNDDQIYKVNTKIKFIHLPYFNSYLSSLKKPLEVLKTFYYKYPKDTDLFQFRVPGPYGILLMLLALSKKTPVIAHIVGDSEKIVSGGKKYKGIVRNLMNFYSIFEKKFIKLFSSKIKIMVNGSELYDDYINHKTPENILQLRSSTLLRTDFFERNNNYSEEKAFTLLYVGYLRHEKGLEYLIHAFQKLKQDHSNLILKIVGDGPEKERLVKLSKDLGVNLDIKFMGYIPLGDKLNKIYIDSDIFILPSISEGTPRVLLEAMAKSLPVIASNVGGIPNTITHQENGILVKSKSDTEIVKAVNMLLYNEEIYKQYKNNGFQFAKNNLLENVINDMVVFACKDVQI